jgi:branched-chain amino acid transport system ATP-binding protein
MEILKLDGISKHFLGLKAVENVSFSVKQGEIFSLIGPNGAGKTTLFNIISGHYSPTKGRKYFEGEDITGLRDFEVAEKYNLRNITLDELGHLKKMSAKDVMTYIELKKGTCPFF